MALLNFESMNEMNSNMAASRINSSIMTIKMIVKRRPDQRQPMTSQLGGLRDCARLSVSGIIDWQPCVTTRLLRCAALHHVIGLIAHL